MKLPFTQGTNSNGLVNKYLQDEAYGFQVISTDNFFRSILGESEKFDALFDNPPWDKWFLALYFRFVRFMAKPCILILPKRATTWESFLKVFGRTITRSIISNGTLAERQLRIAVAKRRKTERIEKSKLK